MRASSLPEVRMPRFRALTVALAFFALPLAMQNPARAEWPERTITIVVPFGAGGPGDVVARILAAELAKRLNQSVIVENRVGASGNIALTAVARAAPDGYTLTAMSNVILINPLVHNVPYDPLTDFAPVAYLGASPNAIVASPASGITTLDQLIAKARANPGKLTFATAGIGSVSQLAVELLKVRTNIDMIHVPYGGAAPSMQAAASNTTDLASIAVGGLVGNIRAGMVKALVQTGAERLPDLPDVPTMQEAGIPNAVVETWQMLLAPAKTPEPVIAKLTEVTRAAMTDPEVQARIRKTGVQPGYAGPEQLHARMAKEMPMWKEIVDRAGIKQD
jgi:tripartite-type tricarboxylate transporter receptor subunit TctC